MSHNLIPKIPTANELFERPQNSAEKRKPKRAPWGSLKIPSRFHFDEDYIYDYQYRLANAFSLIERSTKISSRDKDLIRRFDKVLQAVNDDLEQNRN